MNPIPNLMGFIFFWFSALYLGVDLLQQGDLLGGVINTYLALTKNNIEDESSNIHGIWMGVNPPLMGCRILNQPFIDSNGTYP